MVAGNGGSEAAQGVPLAAGRFVNALAAVGEPLFAAIEDQATCALARILLDIDPNLNTGPHGHAVHLVVEGFGAQLPEEREVSAHGEALLSFRLWLGAAGAEALVWSPRRLGGVLPADAGLPESGAVLWWDYRPRAAVDDATVAQDASRLAAVRTAFDDGGLGWGAARRDLWGLPAPEPRL